MTKVILMSAALVAAAVIANQAQAARGSNAATRHTMNRTHIMTDCVRAPNVGAFATAPYTEPPCMPSTMN